MRNEWFPKNMAEYMTKNRFMELGLTEAAIGTRDRAFGTKFTFKEEKKTKKIAPSNKKETLTLPVSTLAPSWSHACTHRDLNS